MKLYGRLLVGISSLCFFLTATAGTMGIDFTYLLIPKDPSHLHGYKGGVWYQPQSFQWGHVDVYFEASVGHWWLNGASTPNRMINIVAVAPYLRYYLDRNACFSPYVEASIGPSYLSKTRLDDRNLGIHFSFQDQVAIGATFGQKQQFSASFNVMHYSNGSMSAHNAGITIPLLLNLAYRF